MSLLVLLFYHTKNPYSCLHMLPDDKQQFSLLLKVDQYSYCCYDINLDNWREMKEAEDGELWIERSALPF